MHAAMIELLLLLLVHVKPEHSEVDRKYISSRYADEEAQTSKNVTFHSCILKSSCTAFLFVFEPI